MTQWLELGVAVTLKMGPFVDATDGVTPEGALTIQKADVLLAKNGGAYGAASADQGVADAGAPYDANGDYDIDLDEDDTDTAGRLRVSIAIAGARIVTQDFMVGEREAIVDDLNTAMVVYDVAKGTDVGVGGNVNVVTWGGKPVLPQRNIACWHKD